MFAFLLFLHCHSHFLRVNQVHCVLLQALLEKQNQALQKQEEDRRRNEAELLRQQQIALMEAQREEQQKRMREQTGKFPIPKFTMKYQNGLVHL